MCLSVLTPISSGALTVITSHVPLSDCSDETLMHRYAKGDYRAFEMLYKRHRKSVFNFLLRYTKSQEAAEELAQDVFLRVIQNASKYATKAKFTTWLYTIARNLCIDRHRRKRHNVSLTLPRQKSCHQRHNDTSWGQPFARTCHEQTGEHAAFLKDIRITLESGVAQLPPEQREVFGLRTMAQLSYKEIASIVGTRENTAKSRMRYALEFLRRHFEIAGFSKDDLLELQS